MKPGTLLGHLFPLDSRPRTTILVAVSMTNLVGFGGDDFMERLHDLSASGRFFRRALILFLGDALLAGLTFLREVTGAESTGSEDWDSFLRHPKLISPR